MTDVLRVYPKLRSRQQITVRYRELQDQHEFWKDLATHPTAQSNPFIRHHIDIEIARARGALDALLYALHDVV